MYNALLVNVGRRKNSDTLWFCASCMDSVPLDKCSRTRKGRGDLPAPRMRTTEGWRTRERMLNSMSNSLRARGLSRDSFFSIFTTTLTVCGCGLDRLLLLLVLLLLLLPLLPLLSAANSHP